MLAVLQSLLTLVLVGGAFGFLLTRLLRLGSLVNAGTRGDEVLTDSPRARVAKVVQMVFGHRKVLEDRWAGLLHVIFLYGFLVLGIGHLEVVLEGLTAFLKAFGGRPFTYDRILPASLLGAYHLSQDLLAFLVLVAAAVALGRRMSGRIKRLTPRSRDGEIILWFIVGLYVTFFLLMGSSTRIRMAAGGTSAPVATQPFSSGLAAVLALSPEGLAALHGASYWAHLLVFLGFGCYIPLSKHMHLVFAAPNIYFFRRKRYGLPPPLDLERTEKFGIDRVQELPWKSLLDTFACTECGRCNVVCPAHETGKPLQPMKVLHDLKVNLRYRNAEGLMAGRGRSGRPEPGKEQEVLAFEPKVPLVSRLAIDSGNPGVVRQDGAYLQVDGQIHLDEIWSCTTCAACVEVCPVLIDSVPGTLIGLRQSLVMMESEFPPEATNAFKGMEVKGNPWGMGPDRRLEWAEGLEVPLLDEIAQKEPERQVEYLFWVGCAGATDPRARKTQQALVKVLKAARVDFAILGPREKCTGDPARRMGNEYVFQQLARENVETLKRYRFRKILVTCPHCLNSLGNDYREFGGEFQVVHHSQLLAELLREGRVPLDATREISDQVTFHDPCYLGRYNKGYEPPREVLVRLGVRSTEMEKSRQNGFCCGAGGGRIFLEERLGKRVNVERTEQALATGADTVAVGCPFCMTMITDGTKAKSVDERVKVKDLAELVADRLAGPRDRPKG